MSRSDRSISALQRLPTFGTARLVAAFGALAASCGCASMAKVRDPAADINANATIYGHFLASQYAELSADPETAAALTERLTKLAPDHPEVLAVASRRALAVGDFDAARKFARRERTFGGNSALARWIEVVDLMTDRKYKAVAEILGARPEDMFAAQTHDSLAAWALAGARDIDGARAALVRSHDLPALDDFALLDLAMILDYAGRTDEAVTYYRETWANGVRMAGPAMAYGRALVRLGRRDEARTLFEAYLSEVGPSPAIAAALDDLARPDTSPPRALSLREGLALSMMTPASALHGQGDRTFEAAVLHLILNVDPNQDGARLLLAETYKAMGRPEDMIRALESVAPDSPFAVEAEIAVIDAWAKAGRLPEAIAKGEAAFARSQSPTILFALCNTLREQAELTKAEACYTRLIGPDRATTSWSGALLARGAVYDRQGDWGAARADLEAALVLAPQSAEVLNYLGYGLADRGEELLRAQALLQEAVRLKPGDGHMIDSLGWVHFKLGDYVSALDLLEQAATLNPEEPIINEHLGDLYWRLGRYQDARLHWARAEKLAAETLDPTSDRVARVRQKLMSGLDGTSADVVLPDHVAPN